MATRLGVSYSTRSPDDYAEFMAIFSYQTENGHLSDESRMNAIDYVLDDQYSLGETESDDPSHGWKGDSENIGELRFYRPLPLYRLRSGRKQLRGVPV